MKHTGIIVVQLPPVLSLKICKHTGVESRSCSLTRTSTSRWSGSACSPSSVSSPPSLPSSPSCWTQKGSFTLQPFPFLHSFPVFILFFNFSLHLCHPFFALGSHFHDRFLYPEKCVVFLNLSYLLLAMGYIVRLSAGGHQYKMQLKPPYPSFTLVVDLFYFCPFQVLRALLAPIPCPNPLVWTL